MQKELNAPDSSSRHEHKNALGCTECDIDGFPLGDVAHNALRTGLISLQNTSYAPILCQANERLKMYFIISERRHNAITNKAKEEFRARPRRHFQFVPIAPLPGTEHIQNGIDDLQA
jgi:hypothetical protein